MTPQSTTLLVLFVLATSWSTSSSSHYTLDILRQHIGHYFVPQYVGDSEFDDGSNIDSLVSTMGAQKAEYRAGSVGRKVVVVEIPETATMFGSNTRALRAREEEAAATSGPSPAPAPSPLPVNITAVISNAGLFTTFLNLLTVTGVDDIFQAQANDSRTGITIFCPTDKAFAALPAGTINKLTAQEKIDLVKSQALSAFYSLASLQQFTDPVAPTLATSSHGAGSYTVNITNDAGSVVISTGRVKSTIISTLYNTNPVAIFAINKVLLPVEIFGLAAPSPSPSPSPSSFLPPDISPTSSSSPSSPANSGKPNALAPASEQSNRASPFHSNSVPFMALILVWFLFLL